MYSKLKMLSILLTFTMFLTSCSKPQLAPLNSESIILAFGDSLTFGYGVDPVHSYPSVLEKLGNVQVINAGVSGETTAEGLLRLPMLLEEHNPSIVVLLEGGNDVLQRVPELQIAENLRKMIELIQDHGAQIVLVGVPEKKLFGDALPLYESLADEYQVPLEAEIVASLIKRPSMKSDFVHFNEKGYAALAEAIYEMMIEHGAYSR